MKVQITDSGILIVPETDFEEQYLLNEWDLVGNYEAYLKTGLSSSDVLGLKITKNKTHVTAEKIT